MGVAPVDPVNPFNPLDPVELLVVDQRPGELAAVVALLEGAEHRVIAASSAAEAEAWLRRGSFAALLLDVATPAIDGIALATRVRAHEGSRELPILFFTSNERDAARVSAARGLGGLDSVARPLEPEVLRGRVAPYVALLRKSREIERLGALVREHDRREHELERAELRATRQSHEAQEAQARSEEVQRRVAILAEVSRLLGESLDLPTSLGNVARYLVASASLGCVIEVRDGDGESLTTAAAHRDARGEELVGAYLALDSAARRAAALAADADADAAASSTPIETRAGAAGSITLFGGPPAARWSHDERDFMRDIGRRVGLFVENAGLYEEARLAVAARDEFLSIAAHELRTPLTAMMLHIQALGRSLRRQGREAFSLDGAIVRIDAAERQVGRLAHLIEALLDVSRIAARRLALELEDVDLGAVAREVAAKLGEASAQEGSSIEVRAAEGIIGRWDPLRVEQVISNLLANAIKYGHGAPIEITARLEGEVAVLVVRDHGIGIAPEHLERIFARFERGVPSASYGGLGLGLYLARQIVGAHGGSIAAVSVLGEGAEPTVRLPLVARASAAELVDDAQQHADSHGFSQDS